MNTEGYAVVGLPQVVGQAGTGSQQQNQVYTSTNKYETRNLKGNANSPTRKTAEYTKVTFNRPESGAVVTTHTYGANSGNYVANSGNYRAG